ncbi:hypothetical protein DL93DRAFT_2087518 [Clavulina sp. PMI_390]|nr:hypothetical protein DL93DRAFT_2087518 [Clavulina sp. PMI_390]
MCRCRAKRGKLNGGLDPSKLLAEGANPPPLRARPRARARARKRTKSSTSESSHCSHDHEHSASPDPTKKELEAVENTAREKSPSAPPADTEVVKAET